MTIITPNAEELKHYGKVEDPVVKAMREENTKCRARIKELENELEYIKTQYTLDITSVENESWQKFKLRESCPKETGFFLATAYIESSKETLVSSDDDTNVYKVTRTRTLEIGVMYFEVGELFFEWTFTPFSNLHRSYEHIDIVGWMPLPKVDNQ